MQDAVPTRQKLPQAAARRLPEWVNAKEADRGVVNDLAWFDFVPTVRELFQSLKGKRCASRVERGSAFEPARADADSTSDPHHTYISGS